MDIKNINRWLGKVSYLKLAGINKFILLEVYNDEVCMLLIKNKEAGYKFTGSCDPASYAILDFSRSSYSNNTNELSSILNDFVKKNKAGDAYLIIGINEYRTRTLTIDKETEDIPLWFLENMDKFIPPGRPAKEFNFSYERYNEDDDNYFYLVALTRDEYINNLVTACENCEVKLLSITSFPLAFHSFEFVQDVRAIFIRITNDVIKYSYSDVNNNLFVNELYHKIFSSDSGEGVNYAELDSSLRQIAEAVKIASTGNTQGELHLYLSVDKNYFEVISDSAGKIFNPVSINKDYEKTDPSQLGIFFGLLKEVTRQNDKINFLPEERVANDREEVEKQITFRVTLASGGVLISLLLLLFLLESFVSGRIKAGQEDLLEVNAKKTLITQFEEENSNVNLNLSSLKKIKEKRSSYSSLFVDLSEVITPKSCFSSLKLSESEGNKSNLVITGIALSRSELASVMKNMEDKAAFMNILLSYSNSIASEDVETNIHISQKEIIEYKIICDYTNAY